MDELASGVRTRAQTLDALIREAVARAQAGKEEVEGDAMLFLGNRHQSFPALVVRDPVLEPVDKLVWMAIMLTVYRSTGNTAFPGHDAIGRIANISSRSTVARAIAVLRSTRWLTLCARVRSARGRFSGNVYALHDEPLGLADALHLDDSYMAFLEASLNHGHARVRAVVRAVLDSMDEDIGARRDVLAQAHPLQRRLERMVLSGEAGVSRRFFAFTANTVRQLWGQSASTEVQDTHRDQNSNTVNHHDQNLVMVSSSSDINKTTTTTSGVTEKKSAPGRGEFRSLVWPSRLDTNQRIIAERYLRTIDAEHWQAVLDELEGRFRAEAKGMDPLYDELSFLHALCKAVTAGKFHPRLGLRVCSERTGRAKIRMSACTPRIAEPAEETAEQRIERMTHAREHMAKIRAILGMAPPAEKPADGSAGGQERPKAPS